MDLTDRKYLPPIIMRLIGANLTYPELLVLARGSKLLWEQLFVSELAKTALKYMIARELDLPYNQRQIANFSIQDLTKVYRDSLELYKPQLGRFVGYKTSHGSWGFPSDPTGPLWFFLRPKLNIFSSGYNKGEPVMITGIFHGDDLTVQLQSNPLFNRMLSYDIRQMKISRLRDKIHNRSQMRFDSDEIFDILDPHLMKHLAIRSNWMRFYRYCSQYPNEQSVIKQILHHDENPMRGVIEHLAVLDRDRSQQWTAEKKEETMMQYQTHFKQSLEDMLLTSDLSLQHDIDEEATKQVKIKSKDKLMQYYEMKSRSPMSELFLINSIYVEQGEQKTCPGKTLVIYAHMEDFNYAELPELVQIANQCKTLEMLQTMQRLGKIPKSSFQRENKAGLPYVAQMEFFDMKVQQHAQVKIVAWIDFPRKVRYRSARFEVVLPRAVSAKYVTVSILESEDYMMQMGSPIAHMGKNVDMKAVALFGSRIMTSLLNFKQI